MNATSNQKISGHLQNVRTRLALQQMKLTAYCAQGRAGRVLLHLMCACGDHQVRWHLQGIAREFAGQMAWIN